MPLEFILRNGTAGKNGSSSLTSLTGGAWPLRRYWLKTKPVKAMKKRGFCHIALEYNEDDYDNNLKNQE